MRKPFVLAIAAIVGFSFVVFSEEDLGELAKKEKKRREEIEKKEKKTKTYTNEDIDDLKGTLAIESTTEEAPADPSAPVETTAVKPSVKTKKDKENELSRQMDDIDQQISNLRKQIEEQRAREKQARDTIGAGGIFHTRNVGEQYAAVSDSQAKVREFEQKIQTLQSQKEDLQEQKESLAAVKSPKE